MSNKNFRIKMEKFITEMQRYMKYQTEIFYKFVLILLIEQLIISVVFHFWK